MMTRKERRAAEHAARKADRKAGFVQSEPVSPAAAPTASIETSAATETEPPVPVAPNPAPAKNPISPAQIQANRRNAVLSHGPITEAGRAKVSLNALKTGLTGAKSSFPPMTPRSTNLTSSPTKKSSSPSVPRKPTSSNPSSIPAGVSPASRVWSSPWSNSPVA